MVQWFRGLGFRGLGFRGYRLMPLLGTHAPSENSLLLGLGGSGGLLLGGGG